MKSNAEKEWMRMAREKFRYDIAVYLSKILVPTLLCLLILFVFRIGDAEFRKFIEEAMNWVGRATMIICLYVVITSIYISIKTGFTPKRTDGSDPNGT